MSSLINEASENPPFAINSSEYNMWDLGIRDLLNYRDLLFFLVRRDILVRYKQTIFGILWAVITPLSTMVVFTIIFGGFAKIPSDGIPYPVFSFAALVPWTFFQSSVSSTASSLVANAGMIKKVYFPRLVIPLARILAGTIDFLIAFAILLAMIFGYRVFGASDFGIAPARFLLLPLFFIAMFIVNLGIGLWLGALNIQFRDVHHSTGILLRLWMYVTPVIYPTSMVPSQLRLIYGLNPMTGRY